ncbi:MAG: amidohydrolase family protein [Polyangiaceae bacterium]
MKKSDPDDPVTLPVKIDSTTNGEFWPRPLDPRLARNLGKARQCAVDHARRLGVSRREYLQSTCGAALAFLAVNELGCRGGGYAVTSESALDKAVADRTLAGREFIFDVQTHAVSAARPWWDIPRPSLADFLKNTPRASCGGSHWAQCFTDDVLIKEVFLHSDTNLAVLSALWGYPSPIEVDEAAKTREQIAKLEGKRRLRIHGGLQPNEAPFAEIVKRMHVMVDHWKIDAWKLYPVWGPERRGFWLNEDLGMRTIQAGLDAGVPLFAVHKGLPLDGMDPKFTRPTDIGPVARAFPKATFLVYHAGWEADRTEGPYDPKADRGVDALIRSCLENGIGKDGNVYAELGSTWRWLMKNPDEAAHMLGKLLRYLGEDRILWGTDSIWYGSPQDQIQAFRAFQISPEFQERFGYPALTPERKRKIFGLNAAKVYGLAVDEVLHAQQSDNVTKARHAYTDMPSSPPRTYGPRTRREMLAWLRHTRGTPG